MSVGEVDFSRISLAQVLHKSYLFELENIPVLPVRVFRTLVVTNPDTGGVQVKGMVIVSLYAELFLLWKGLL